MASTVLDRLGVAKWVILGLVVAGAALVTWGAARGDGYLASVLLEIGAALFLAVPLLFLERLMEGRITALQEAAEQSIDDVRTQVQGVRQEVHDARTQIDELGLATARQIAEERAADAEAVRAVRDDVSEPNVWRLLRRGQQLGGLDSKGVRVPLPNAQLRVRFTASSTVNGGSDGGTVRLAVETRDGERLGDSEDWSSAEPAAHALARLAGHLQRAGRYPGDASFDAVAIFERLAETVDAVVSLRTGRRDGAHLGPVIELSGDWAITANGLENVRDESRAVPSAYLLSAPDKARADLVGPAADMIDAPFAEAFETAVEYHSGEDRRAARKRVPRER